MQAPARPSVWLYAPWLDGPFILAPAFLVSAAVLLFPGFFTQSTDDFPGLWLALIVGVDVAHVYASLYRTYLDPAAFRARRRALLLTPALCAMGALCVYAVAGELLFWRCAAYLAVWHFVRQQYGFMRLYARRERRPRWARRLDAITVYAAAGYPVLYWHLTPRAFNWFVEGDFLRPGPGASVDGLRVAAGGLYVCVLMIYVIKESYFLKKEGVINIPKNAIIAGTALSWYLGIVAFDADLAFTATNVVAHGLPYMALVWAAGRTDARAQGRAPAFWFRAAAIPAFIGLFLALGFVEEGLWDGLVWRERPDVFAPFWSAEATGAARILAVALLATPQLTHYVLDAWLWRPGPGGYRPP